MSSIDGTPIEPPEIRRAPTSDKKAETLTSPSTGSKRKAEDDLKSPSNDKISKVSRASKTAQSLKAKPAEASSYKGTSRPEPSAASTTAMSKNALPKNALPKKGSFAEILARAKQNQVGPVKTITHKPKEKLSTKKEIALEKEMAKKRPVKGAPEPRGGPGKGGIADKSKEMAIRRTMSDGKSAPKPAKPGAYQGTSRPVNRAQQSSGYQGTAKAKPQPSYQGTMKTAKNSSSSLKRAYHSDSEPGRSKLQSSSKHHRKEEEYDDESEGYDSEDPYTYASEDFSDMDAGFEDMEEEDEMAARIAKKEDAAEQARLEKLKREKDKKKSMASQGRRS